VSNRQGFTIVEVVVAMMVLSVGVLALVSSSAVITRMIGRGQHSTRATQVAERRLETVRQVAHATVVPCANLNAGTTVATTDGMSESWQVTAAGTQRNVAANVTYNVPGGTRTVTLRTIISCK
jgi:prepilin-type N-terminal cleavage/methylation domain-containing protein